MLRQLFVVFQGFFSIISRQKFECCDISLPFAFYFVTTIVDMFDNCSSFLGFSTAFLVLFASFDLDSCKTIILVKIS